MKNDVNVPSFHQMNMNQEQSSSFDDNSNNSENKKKKRRKVVIIILIIIIPIITALAIVLGITLNKSSNKKYRTEPSSNSYSLYPSHIDGIAGEKYYVSLEKNEQNNCFASESVTFLNSYGLNKSQLIINVEQNKKAKCLAVEVISDFFRFFV